MLKRICNIRGQGTIEAAVVIPVLFLLMLMLLQPGIVLYDLLVMSDAAAEGCRLLSTKTDAAGSMDEACESFVRHRLSAIPQHDCFHVHGDKCSWKIEMIGDEAADSVTVSIRNELRPLPLFDAGSKLIGLANKAGNIEIERSVTMPTQPAWISNDEVERNPSDWIGAWCE